MKKSKMLGWLFIVLIGLFLIDILLVRADKNAAIREFEKRQATRDSIILAQEKALEDMSDSTRIYSEQLDSLIGVTDSSFAYIERLTKVDVTPDDIDESLLWIEQYNDTLP